MPIRSMVYYIIVGESASTNSLKRLVLCLGFVIVAGETEISDLYKTFPDLLL